MSATNGIGSRWSAYGNVDFIGAGWSYPLGTDATGSVALVVREREIEQAIRLILGTACGERPMRPEFGCRIHDHVFAPGNSTTAGQIAYDVRRALEQWEPRVEVLNIGVSFDQMATGTLLIEVTYEIRGLNDPRNLVFPFYVIPEHDDTAAAIEASTPRPALLAGGALLNGGG